MSKKINHVDLNTTKEMTLHTNNAFHLCACFMRKTLPVWGVIAVAMMMAHVCSLSFCTVLLCILAGSLFADTADECIRLRMSMRAVNAHIRPNDNVVPVRINGAPTLIKVNMETPRKSTGRGLKDEAAPSVCSIQGDMGAIVNKGRLMARLLRKQPVAKTLASLESDYGRVTMSKLRQPLRIEAAGCEVKDVVYAKQISKAPMAVASGDDESLVEASKHEMSVSSSLWGDSHGLTFEGVAEGGVRCSVVAGPVAEDSTFGITPRAFIVHDSNTLSPAYLLKTADGHALLVASGDGALVKSVGDCTATLPKGLTLAETRAERNPDANPLDVLEAHYTLSEDDRVSISMAKSLRTVTMKSNGKLTVYQQPSGGMRWESGTARRSVAMPMAMTKISALGIAGTACLSMAAAFW